MLKNGIIWIVGLAIALASGLAAVGAVAKDKAPQLAVSLQPANGFAFERLASNSLKAAVAANDGLFPNSVDPVAASFAKQAFLSEPVTPEAIAVLALGTTEGKKRELMHRAFALSRRQQLILGWMIVDAGTREDIPAILSHYDTMLRTSSATASAVIPIMVGALANDNFVVPFASLLAKQPPWAPRFWGAVVTIPEAIGNAARLRELLYMPNESEGTYRDENLIRALVNNNQFETAEALYHLLVGRKKARALLENGSFEAEPKYSPIDWQLFSTGEYGAVITDSELKLSAIQNSGGKFARRLVNLPARVLTIEIVSSTNIFDNAQIFITLTCAQKINETPRPTKILLKSKIETFKLDNSQSGCHFYWLDINGRTSGNSDGFDVALDSLQIFPS